MAYTLKHSHVDQALQITVTKNTEGDSATVRCSESGSFRIGFPGKLLVRHSVTYFVHNIIEPVPGEEGGKPQESHLKALPLTLEIRTPDGRPFTADHVTLSDLQKFRDLRGISQGQWTFSIHGESEPISVDPASKPAIFVGPDKGHVRIAVEETVPSQSAPPLVNDKLPAHTNHRYTFDLYRVGTFTATANSGNPFIGLLTPRTMKLFDPDGVVVATSIRGRLTFPVTLVTLNKSRTSVGASRLWSLEVLPSLTPADDKPTTVFATVIETARIPTSVLQDRINFLLGDHGSKLSIFGENKDSDLLARLRILDIYSAETIDMLDLLDSVIKPAPPEHIEAKVDYTLASHTRDLGHELHVSLNDLKIGAIDIVIGASEKIQPILPALGIEVRIEGDATVKIGGFPLATVKIRDNSIHMEVGLRLNADGTFSVETWIEEDRLDIDVHWAAAVAAGVISVGLLTLGEIGVTEIIEHEFNAAIPQGFHSVLANVMGQVPRIMAVMLGDVFTYRSLRLEGDDILLDYIAPLESEPKPSANYRGIIGRAATQLGPDTWRISPPSLGDTWKADNLATKIEHIVVVMMENRSFDHVLGYRAQLPGGKNSDGLNTKLINALASKGFSVGKLNKSLILANAFGFKTKFPVSVGHELADVIEQLSQKIEIESGRFINSPAGFVSNFAPHAEAYFKLHKDEIAHKGEHILKDDVLGYYEASDLPFFKFLAENYAYCEQFYCSHPGPTLPNRTFSLTGTLQYDRTGEGIPDNNHSDNFFLSRAMTIFDLLTRKGIGWRVYESFPSVTMLRMFARYATDNTNIVPLGTGSEPFARLQQDVTQGNLPAVTIIEPAMHHSPESDDHSPFADMYNGQRFLKGVYDTLRSNEALWSKTMLIITYDEHGGFYDHVIPPMAEVRTRPAEINDPTRPPTGHFTPSTQTTNYGLRVPTFIVSPWVPAGKGPDIVLDFCSILKTMIARFCGQDKPFVSDRVNASRSLDAYLSEAALRMNVPASPEMLPLPNGLQKPGPAIVTPPISRKQMRDGNVDYHELTGMLARLLGR